MRGSRRVTRIQSYKWTAYTFVAFFIRVNSPENVNNPTLAEAADTAMKSIHTKSSIDSSSFTVTREKREPRGDRTLSSRKDIRARNTVGDWVCTRSSNSHTLAVNLNCDERKFKQDFACRPLRLFFRATRETVRTNPAPVKQSAEIILVDFEDYARL
jgi:hypothetical protein